jgi:hypothetical protein
VRCSIGQSTKKNRALMESIAVAVVVLVDTLDAAYLDADVLHATILINDWYRSNRTSSARGHR